MVLLYFYYYHVCINFIHRNLFALNIDPVKSKPRNSSQEWNEVQVGINGYYKEVRSVVIKDRFLKGKCDPFRAANITSRKPFFLHYKVIKKSDINPNRDTAKKTRGLAHLLDDHEAEEEKMMLEFNNSFTKNKTCYDPLLLVGVLEEEPPLLQTGEVNEFEEKE